MRITVEAERIEISTQRDCEPERWNSSSGRVDGVKEEVRSLNIYLDSLQAKVYEVHRSLLDKGDPITADNIKKKLRGETERPRMILKIFQQHNDQVAMLVGKDFSSGTRAFYNLPGSFKEFYLLEI